MKRMIAVVSMLLVATGSVRAAEEVDFAKDVWPILKENCFDCHGDQEQKGDLRLDRVSRLLDLAEEGEVLSPGNPDESELYHRISLPADHEDRMPAEGDPLSDEQIQTIRTWIEQGAGMGEIHFASDIWPILEQNCVDCHGPDKQEGDLRLDSREGMLNEDYILGEAGDALTSELYFRVSMPEGDPDIMPPSDAADPLPEEHQERIKRWVENGAFFGGWERSPLAERQQQRQLPEVEPAAENALAKLRELGALAMPIAKDTNLISVDFRAEAENIGNSHLDNLRPVAEQVYWLNLAGTKISDAGLAKISDLPHIARLHLENTAISDAGLEHLSELTSLRYLNLYGTKVTDDGLKHLEPLTELRKLYLWQTEVTPEAAMSLEEKLPEVRINMGWEYERQQREQQQQAQRASRGEEPLKAVIELNSPEGQAPQDLDPSGKALTLAAHVKPDGSEGVVMARGGQSLGYALYLREGKPTFAIRSEGELKKVVGPEALPAGEAAHLVGLLDEEQKLHLYVNGEQVAEAEGHFIASNPGDGFSAGEDSGSRVGDYEGALPFSGSLKDLRVYWGAATDEAVRDWASEYGFGPAIRLADPYTEDAPEIDPSNSPLTVGAYVNRQASHCVLLAQGGETHGYSLYLVDGKPRFSIRSEGELKTVAIDEALPEGEAVHVVGVLDEDDALRLYIDGEQVAEAEGQKIASKPGDPFNAGTDSNSYVGEYGDDTPEFQGELKDLRVYLEARNPSQIREWAAKSLGRELAQAESEPINKTCPVSGEPIDPSKTVVHEGKTVAFCCDNCKAKFEENPQEFLSELDAFAEANEEQADAGEPINDQCPFSGEPIDPSKTFVFNGKTVGFCCGDCLARFKSDPEKFASEVEGLN